MKTIAISTIPNGEVFFRLVMSTTAIRIGMKIAPRRAARDHEGGLGSRTMRDFDELDDERFDVELERAAGFEALLGSISSGSTSFPSLSR